MAVLPEEKLQMVKKLDIELDQQMQDHMTSFVKKPNGADLDYLVKLVTVDMYCDKYIEDHDPEYASTLNASKAAKNGQSRNYNDQSQTDWNAQSQQNGQKPGAPTTPIGRPN